MSKLAAALAFLGLNFYIYGFLATGEVIPERRTFEAFPLRLDEWSCRGQAEMERKTRRILGVTDYLLCDYLRAEPFAQVAVYIGYHETQVRKEGGGGQVKVIHPPEHCMPGSGWDIVDARLMPLSLPGLPSGHGWSADGPLAKRFLIAKGEHRQLVYFWYQSRGRVIAKNQDVILMRFWDRATRQRTDGSLVRFMTPIQRGDVDAAEANIREVAMKIVPLLNDYIPQ
jgi:EpsI family protein